MQGVILMLGNLTLMHDVVTVQCFVLVCGGVKLLNGGMKFGGAGLAHSVSCSWCYHWWKMAC